LFHPQIRVETQIRVEMNSEATVYIVDDDEDARALLTALVCSMGLKAEAFSSGEEFLKSSNHPRPGCVLTDLRMPGMNGLELQAQLARNNDTIPVILISAHAMVDSTVQAMRSGAVTVIEKPYREQELWEAIGEAVQRDVQIYARQTRTKRLHELFSRLTIEESQVLDQVAKGLPNKNTASQLGISLRTVEDRRQRVMRKLQVDSFAELMEVVIEARSLDILKNG